MQFKESVVVSLDEQLACEAILPDRRRNFIEQRYAIRPWRADFGRCGEPA